MKNNDYVILIEDTVDNFNVISFLRKFGIRVVHSLNDGSVPDFVFGELYKERDDINRIKINSESISFTQSYFDSSFINDSVIQSVIGYQFSTSKDTLIDLFYDETNNKIYSYKLQDYFNIGYTVDQITRQAYLDKFDYINVRKLIGQALLSFFNSIALNKMQSLYEVKTMCDNDLMIMQLDFSIKEDCEVTSNQIIELAQYCNYLFINKMNDRITCQAVWFKSNKLSSFKSYFYFESLVYFNQSPNEYLDGYGIGNFSLSPSNLQNHSDFYLAKTIANFIMELFGFQDFTKQLDEFNENDVFDYLQKGEKYELIEQINSNVMELVLNFLKNPTFEKTVSEYVNKQMETDLSEVMPLFKNNLIKANLSDIQEIIKVNGFPSDSFVDLIKISGDKVSQEKKWNIKKQEILNKIDLENAQMSLVGAKINIDDCLTIICDVLNTDVKIAKAMINELLVSAVYETYFYKSNYQEILKKLEENRKKIELLESDNDKLKKIAKKAVGFYKQVVSNQSHIESINGLIDKNKSLQMELDQKNKKIEDLIKNKDSISPLSEKVFLNKLEDESKKNEGRIILLNTKIEDLRKINKEQELDLLDKKQEILKLKSEINALNLKINGSDKVIFPKKRVS